MNLAIANRIPVYVTIQNPKAFGPISNHHYYHNNSSWDLFILPVGTGPRERIWENSLFHAPRGNPYWVSASFGKNSHLPLGCPRRGLHPSDSPWLPLYRRSWSLHSEGRHHKFDSFWEGMCVQGKVYRHKVMIDRECKEKGSILLSIKR